MALRTKMLGIRKKSFDHTYEAIQCEVDRMVELAWQRFGTTPKTGARVQISPRR